MEQKKKGILIVIFLGTIFLGLGTGVLLGGVKREKKIVVPVYSIKVLKDKNGDPHKNITVNVLERTTKSYYYDSKSPIVELYVEEGQKIEKGTPLYRYDTSVLEEELIGIDKQLMDQYIYLEKLGLYIEKFKQIDIASEKKTISIKDNKENAVQFLKIESTPTIEPTPTIELTPTIEPTPIPTQIPTIEEEEQIPKVYRNIEKGSIPYKGQGSKEDPFVYYLIKGGEISDDFLLSIIEKEFCVNVIIVEEENQYKTPLFSWYLDGKKCKNIIQGEMELIPENLIPQIGGNAFDKTYPSYSKEVIEQELKQKKLEYERIKLTIRSLEEQKEDLRKKIDAGAVQAEEEGIVTFVGGIEEGRLQGQPIFQIRGEAKCYLQGWLDEVIVENMEIGEKVFVKVEKDEKDILIPAIVLSIKKEPTEGKNLLMENPSMSYYEFMAVLEENQNIEVYPGQKLELIVSRELPREDMLVIYNEMIFYENGDAYVYVANAEDRLEKRKIETGQSILGNQMEVRQGLSNKDYLAKPGTDGIEEGAEVKYMYGEEMEVKWNQEVGK